MSTKIILNIYSGRPNPEHILRPEEEQELSHRFRRLKQRQHIKVHDVCFNGFGAFRVFYSRENVRSHFLCGGGFVELPFQEFSYSDDAEIGLYLLSLIPKKDIDEDLQYSLAHLHRIRKVNFKPIYPRISSQPCGLNVTTDAQPYDPLWGSGGEYPYVSGTLCNNCYDYANQQDTRSYSQPGLGSGQVFEFYSCDNIMQKYGRINTVGFAAVRDGLVKVKNCTDKLGPGEGWYVALFVDKRKGTDFHWLKQDSSGCWSHKMGQDAVSNVDSNGEPIVNPETAVIYKGFFLGIIDVPLYQRLYEFCEYYRTNRNVTIKGYGDVQGCLEPWW